MNKIEHRQKIAEAMADRSILICCSGIPVHTNSDDYYGFEENSNYYWLTGLERENQALVMFKSGNSVRETLFIEAADAFLERWTGKMPTAADVAKVSGIAEDNVRTIDSLQSFINYIIDAGMVDTAYLDTYKCAPADADDYNLAFAKKFQADFPGVRVRSLRSLICPLRRVKDAEEIADVREAIAITGNGLKEVLARLQPGMMEYQVQAIFEGSCHYQGATRFAFPTIAGSGVNACSMHYGTNRDEIADGSMILLDLGAKYNNYCSDITRTYPANGHYSARQKQFYDLVLKANREIIKQAKPGMTLRDLDAISNRILGEGLVSMDKIKDPSEVGKYYMHRVSHSIGIDAHDICVGDEILRPGMIISDEPGLYIDEEAIGIRIEDDLLITEDGCECLSEAIPRTTEEIEEIMRGRDI